MTVQAEHAEVMAQLDENARRIVQQAALLAVLEAEVEIYRPPVVDPAEEGPSSL